jgi:hypothetical protein
MALLTAGYFPTAFFSENYWVPQYWSFYGVSSVVSVDAYALTIQQGSFREKTAYSGVDQYIWSGGAIKLQHKSYGNVESWTLTAIEDASAVAWVDSAPFHLLTHIADGAAVAFVFDVPTKHSVPVGQTVYVNSVNVRYSSNLKTRYFDLSLRAA